MKKFLSLILIVSTVLTFTALGLNAKAASNNNLLDVKAGDWFANACTYAMKKGYMCGTSQCTFSPDMNVTRGMFAQILSKMNCADTESYENSNSFCDVLSGKWFHNAIEWANSNGLSCGTGGGCYNPDSDVSRQDIAVMLYNYAKKTTSGKCCENYASLDGYEDCREVSDYAKEAVSWAVGNGLICGTAKKTLSPKDTATRGMISVIIENYDKKFSDNDKTESKVNTPIAQNNIANEILNLVNSERKKYGLNALTLSSELSGVANAKAEDFVLKNYFDHNSPTYGSPFDMMKRFGISYRFAGENIAAGQRSAKEVMNGWMNSQGHRENILNPNFKQIGVGYCEGGSYGTYWVQMFIG